MYIIFKKHYKISSLHNVIQLTFIESNANKGYKFIIIEI